MNNFPFSNPIWIHSLASPDTPQCEYQSYVIFTLILTKTCTNDSDISLQCFSVSSFRYSSGACLTSTWTNWDFKKKSHQVVYKKRDFIVLWILLAGSYTVTPIKFGLQIDITSSPPGLYTIKINEVGQQETGKTFNNQTSPHDITHLKPCTEYEHYVMFNDGTDGQTPCSSTEHKTRTSSMSK